MNKSTFRLETIMCKKHPSRLPFTFVNADQAEQLEVKCQVVVILVSR